MVDQLTQPTRAQPQAAAEGRRFLRWAGWCGLIASALYLLTVVVTNLGGPARPDGPADVLGYLSEVAASPAKSYIYGIAGIGFCVIYVPMLLGVYRLLGRTVAAWFGTAALVMGMVLLLPAYVISTMQPGIGETASRLGGAAADSAYAVYGTLATASTVFFTVGSVLTLSFGPLLWSVEALRTRAFARRLAWTGVVTGVSGLSWFVWFFEIGLVLPVLIVNVLSSLVFFFALSAVLVAQGRQAQTNLNQSRDV